MVAGHGSNPSPWWRELAPSACEAAAQGIEGVRFKRLIMDESASDRSFHPPEDASKKRLIFCTGKVQPPGL